MREAEYWSGSADIQGGGGIAGETRIILSQG